jgi:hypothetical protein
VPVRFSYDDFQGTADVIAKPPAGFCSKIAAHKNAPQSGRLSSAEVNYSAFPWISHATALPKQRSRPMGCKRLEALLRKVDYAYNPAPMPLKLA